MKLENLDIENVSLDLDATHPHTGEKIKETFCKDWGSARPVVEGLIEVVKNPFVKILIRLVLTLGDMIKGKICTAEIE